MRDDECPPENPPENRREHPVTVPGSKTGVIAMEGPGPVDHPGASLRNDLFPALDVVSVPISVLTPSKHRTRKLPRKHLEAVKSSMVRYGNRLPILVDRDMCVIDGHARLKAARELGAEGVPCIIVEDLPDKEIRRLALSLNRLQERGEWDEDALRLEVGELIELDGDFELPGFELPELEAMQFAGSDAEDADPADDVSAYGDISTPPVSQLGDLWVLNKHRIFNGDARENKPAGAAFAHMMFTDPPYNLKVNGHIRARGKIPGICRGQRREKPR